MINQKENKQVKMDSWLLKLLSRDMKQKQKTKINQQTTITNNRKIKNNRKKSNGKYKTYHGPLSQKLIDGRYRTLI